MRFLTVFLLFWVALPHGHGQDKEWLLVKDQQTAISVLMPGVPKLEKEDILIGGAVVKKDIFSFKDDRFEMYFETIPFGPGTDNKRAAAREIKGLLTDNILRYGATVRKKEKLTRDGVDYQYAELFLSSGEIIRSVFFADRDKIVHVGILGSMSQVFSRDGNYYLLSWNVGTFEKEDQIETERPDAVESEYMAEDSTWRTIFLDNTVQASFPGTPFRKNTVVDFGNREIQVEAWSRHSDSGKMNFVITKRIFGPDEGQLTDKDLFEYTANQIVSSRKLKKIEEKQLLRSGQDIHEYTLAKGIRFYRIQISRIGNVVYHALVKGKRRNIHQQESNQFFRSFQPIN